MIRGSLRVEREAEELHRLGFRFLPGWSPWVRGKADVLQDMARALVMHEDRRFHELPDEFPDAYPAAGMVLREVRLGHREAGGRWCRLDGGRTDSLLGADLFPHEAPGDAPWHNVHPDDVVAALAAELHKLSGELERLVHLRKGGLL